MNEVRGGIVIQQLKSYAQNLTDALESSAMVQVKVWCHKYGDGKDFNIEMSAFSCAKNDSIKPRFETEDIRHLGEAINDFINGDKNEERKNRKWMRKKHYHR